MMIMKRLALEVSREMREETVLLILIDEIIDCLHRNCIVNGDLFERAERLT